jgi:hypothetical protein
MSKRVGGAEQLMFLPFLPQDNLPNPNDSPQLDILKHNITQCANIMRMSYLKFLNQIDHNEQLRGFMLSYLSYRSKPFTGTVITSSKEVQEIDRYVRI